MGRSNRYESHVKPRLGEIAEWVQISNENQIAKRLGVSSRTFENYKKDHAELREALKRGREALVEDLKSSLKKKALGYEYTETKTTVRDVDGVRTRVIEEYKKHMPPDTGAIHLLLKNFDESWRNDDRETMDLKKQKLELEKQKAESENW